MADIDFLLYKTVSHLSFMISFTIRSKVQRPLTFISLWLMYSGFPTVTSTAGCLSLWFCHLPPFPPLSPFHHS